MEKKRGKFLFFISTLEKKEKEKKSSSLTKFLSFIAVFSSAPAALIACTVATLSLTDSSAKLVCSMLHCWLNSWSL